MPPIKKITLKKHIKNNKIKNTQHINKKKHNYSKYFPSIYDTNFSKKIASHNLFKNYKLKKDNNKLNQLYKDFEENNSKTKSAKNESNTYILKPTQKLLRNFMSPETPYRGLLIYHEMGVGKTCTAISIAENLKNIVLKSNTKIYVIRPDEIERQIFNINVVKEGNPANQCSGDVYTNNSKYEDLVNKCMNKDKLSCEQLKAKVDKDIKKIYEFNGAQMWANKLIKEIEYKTKNIEKEEDKQAKIKQIIRNNYNNSVIIIDEAHEMHNSEKDGKIVPPQLEKVLKYASNLRLIFLSATPIYDKPQNIISMINYFLINDKRPIMKESEIFDNTGKLKNTGKTILENNIKSYVSYLRGNNPYDFPIRLSAKYNIPEKMFNLTNYPSKDINGKLLDKDDTIKHIELVNCPFQGAQLELINYYIKHSPLKNIKADDFEKMYNNTKTTNNKKHNKKNDMGNKTDGNKTDDDKTDDDNNDDNKTDDNKTDDDDDNDDDIDIQQNVAYAKELQISNFIFQSLSESNNNINLIIGKLGLQQVTIKSPNKNTYKFKDKNYAKRFMLPELKNWGIKIANVLERAIESNGPIFVYTFFKDSGVLPLAFALEMNGFKRYKQHNTPILENEYKDTSIYRGDYIIYSGDISLSQYAKEYLDTRQNMIKEKNVKVFIGTKKASEGINLFGYREVHILSPWHNINLTEQSIGRVIRTGSHLHLPPQDRNVTVYQYATTLKDRETYDLKIYKISEKKAINSGVVEKILKENAFDCELNKEVNIYSEKDYSKEIPLNTSNNKHIKVSLADKPYSRSCFYMKDCEFKCSNSSSNDTINTNSKKTKSKKITLKLKTKKIINDYDNENDYKDFPIMRFNIDKDIDEYKNLIKQLMKTNFNIKITNLKLYLKNIIDGIDNSILDNEIKTKGKKITLKIKKITKTKKIVKHNDTNETNDTSINNTIFEEAFYKAIQDIINEDTFIIDKFNRNSKIVVSGEYLRLVPEDNLIPNIAIQKQIMKPYSSTLTKINLKEYINKLSEKQKLLLSETEYDYNEIMNKYIIEKAEQIYYGTYSNSREYKYNVKMNLKDVFEFVFYKLSYSFKNIIIKTILNKIINNVKLTVNESKIEPLINNHIVLIKNIYPDSKEHKQSEKNIYGYLIKNINNLELFNYNTQINQFELDNGNLKKIIEYKFDLLNKTPKNKLFGFLKYEKNNEIVFKITDIDEKGDKKSVKGITCKTMSTSNIKKNLYKLDSKLIKNIKNNSISSLCIDVEYLLLSNDKLKLNNKKWFYTPEEYYIYFEYN